MTSPIRITRETLERAAHVKRFDDRTWALATMGKTPVAATRDEPERAMRSIALAIAAACAYVPAALLADPAEGRALTPLTAIRNVAVVLLLTVGPAFASVRTERNLDAEDTASARTASRLMPGILGFLIVLTLALSPSGRTGGWEPVELALVLTIPTAFFLHVPRVRAIHVLLAGWGALASVVLDARALFALPAVFWFVALASGLDRRVLVRSAVLGKGPPLSLAFPVISATIVTALATGIGLAALSVLPAPAAPASPQGGSQQIVRLSQPDAHSLAALRQVIFTLAAVVALLLLFHFVTTRLLLRRGGQKPEDDEPPPEPAPVATPLAAPLRPEAAPWPEGPRRGIVMRYLAHLRALRRVRPRSPGATPQDVVASVARQEASLEDAARRLAGAFHLARYSSEDISPERALDADEQARKIEERLDPSR